MSKVKRSAGTQIALGNLNKHNERLRKSVEKISRGQKIIGAEENSSAYVISEKMREQIRTLAQDNQNVQNGATLFKIAEGGINSIVEELRSLKELAVNAANDTNTESDRATIQKVFNQKMANINDIVATTNYNGKTLLDGRYIKGEKFKVTNTTVEYNDTEPILISAGNYTISEDGYYILAKDYTGTVTVNAKNVRLTQEDPSTALSNTRIRCQGGDKNFWLKDLNIAAVTTGSTSGIRFEGNNAKNYLVLEGTNTIAGGIRAENNGTLNILGDGSLNTASEYIIGASDLIIGDHVTVSGNHIYGGSSGDIKIGGSATVTAESICFNSLKNADRSIIIGGNAKITATGSILGMGVMGGSMGDIIIGGNSVVNVTSITNPTGIGIGGRKSSCNNIKIGGHAVVNSTGGIGSCGSTCGDITIGNYAKVTNTSSNMNSAGIGCAMNDTCGDIKIGNNATVIVNNTSGSVINAAIGSGYGGKAGDITISGNANVTITYKSSAIAAGIGGGGVGSSVGDISIGGNATVTTKSTNGAGIGSGQNSTAGNITIGDNANVTASSGNGAGIGSGSNSAVVGNITISNSATVTATSTASGQNIGQGQSSTAGTVTYSNNVHVSDISLSLATVFIPDKPDNPGVIKNYVTTTNTFMGEFKPLKIHHGSKANLEINFYINDMRTKSLGTGKLINGDGTFINAADKEKYIALGVASDSIYQTDKQAEWLATVTAAQNKTLDDISVTTKHNANISIRVLDGAIDYALDEATQVGSYLQRLEYTAANIMTMSENVQSAESAIRDADMAKEMTDYTKFNVLMQSSQSMLAQANQNFSGVLNLLQ